MRVGLDVWDGRVLGRSAGPGCAGDLDPLSWPRGMALEDHPVIKALLAAPGVGRLRSAREKIRISDRPTQRTSMLLDCVSDQIKTEV